MYKFSLLFLSLILSNIELFSQCVPDETFVPIGTNYGLSPDSLATGYINQEYNQDLTFFLPTDTLVDVEGFGETLIIFEDYHISSISLFLLDCHGHVTMLFNNAIMTPRLLNMDVLICMEFLCNLENLM